jgi:hypothetical protein
MGICQQQQQNCCTSFNSFQAMLPYMGAKKGVLFYGGVSPSKIGLIAPYTVQALSKARVFLLG